MEKEIEEDIYKTERGIYDKTSLGNTRPEQRNMSRSRYVGLHNRRSIVDKVWG